MSTMNKEHPPLPRHVAEQLLQLLGSDDQFRNLFTSDVTSALALLGYEPALGRVKAARAPQAGELLYCMTAATLASKEEILQAKDQLTAHLTSETDHRVVFCFESGKVQGALKLRSPSSQSVGTPLLTGNAPGPRL